MRAKKRMILPAGTKDLLVYAAVRNDDAILDIINGAADGDPLRLDMLRSVLSEIERLKRKTSAPFIEYKPQRRRDAT